MAASASVTHPAAAFVQAIQDGMPAADLTRTFSNTIIEGDVELTGVSYAHVLKVTGTTFTGKFDAPDAEFAKLVEFIGNCEFQDGLRLDHSHFKGRLVLDDATVRRGELNETAPEEVATSLWAIRVDRGCSIEGLRSHGRVNLRESDIADSINAHRIWVDGTMDLRLSAIGGTFFCRKMNVSDDPPTVLGDVLMYGTKLRGTLDFTGINLKGNLSLQVAELGGSLECRSLGIDKSPRAVVGGNVSMFGTSVAGFVNLSGISIEKDLNLRSARIEGDLVCRTLRTDPHPRTKIGGTVRMTGTIVGGTMDFSGVNLNNDLNLENADIRGSLICRGLDPDELSPPTVGGSVWMIGTKVGVSADFSGVKIGKDLCIQSATIGADVFCRCLDSTADPRPRIDGEATMIGTRIGGDLDLIGARVRKKFELLNSTVGGDLLCIEAGKPQLPGEFDEVRIDGSRIEGRSILVGCRIEKGIHAHRSHFDDGLFLGRTPGDGWDETRQGPGITVCGNGIDLSFSTISGPLEIGGVAAGGPLVLYATHITGDLRAGSVAAEATRFQADENDRRRIALLLAFARVDSVCELPADIAGNGNVTLCNANLGELVILGDKDKLCRHHAENLQFRRIQVPGQDLVQFLHRTMPFRMRTYQFVENYLREHGHDEAADKVYREMLRRDRRQELGWLRLRIDLFLTSCFSRRTYRKETRDYYSADAAAHRLLDKEERKPVDPKEAVGQTKSVASDEEQRMWPVRVLGSVYHFGTWMKNLLLDATTGHGTQSGRLGLLLLAQLLLLWSLFATDPRSVVKAGSAEDAFPDDGDAAWFRGGGMAVRTMLPMLDLPIAAGWEVSSRPAEVPFTSTELWFTYDGLRGVIGVANYLIVPLFLVSVWGLLKRRGD